MAACGIFSAYHGYFYNQKEGPETRETFIQGTFNYREVVVTSRDFHLVSIDVKNELYTSQYIRQSLGFAFSCPSTNFPRLYYWKNFFLKKEVSETCRSLEKLKNVATEIESSYHVKTRVVVADYTQNNIYESIEKEINDLYLLPV
ncbi:unnamed protein product [Heterobilharzia americana]|nr:unnamed protein product [Heterobilharzia americana]